MIRKLFARFPTMEVLCRIVYKDYLQKSKWFHKAADVYQHNQHGAQESPVTVDDMLGELAQMGVKRGDILIVHSSMDGLHNIDATPREILEGIMGFLGEEGTLVLPAYPFHKEQGAPEKAIRYDPSRTVAWTGILPNVFLSIKGTVRSNFPKNSLAANGKYAEEMFANELRDTASHGPHSAWNFCAEHHAKVVFLGVSPNHSFSEVHMAEGVLEENWPIRDWYYSQRYQIKIKGEWQEKTFLVRRTFWNRYLTEEYAIAQAMKAGMMAPGNGTCRAYVPDLGALKDWLLRMAAKGNLIFYKIPRKFWKAK